MATLARYIKGAYCYYGHSPDLSGSKQKKKKKCIWFCSGPTHIDLHQRGKWITSQSCTTSGSQFAHR